MGALIDDDEDSCWEHISAPTQRVISKATAAWMRPDLADVIWDDDTVIIWEKQIEGDKP